MKNIKKNICGAVALLSLSLTGCMEAPVPMDSSATNEQLASSSKATEALAFAMPSFLNKYATYNDNAYDWGYGSLMHIRDVETADVARVSCGYNWYSQWSENQYLGPLYVSTYLPWAYYYQGILTANNTIKALAEQQTERDAEGNLVYVAKDIANTDYMKGLLAAGFAYRALFYLDAAQWYEFLPNDIFQTNEDGQDVSYLTLPIVTEASTEEATRNNPRATRDSMYQFIKNDLKYAIEFGQNFERPNKTLPNIVAIYGLCARLNLWVEKYEEAAKWARMAIDAGLNTPLTSEEWLSTTKGFNDDAVDSWIWSSRTVKEDDVVQTGILNWTSWMSNEALFGYAAAQPFIMIGSELYNRINDTDFRKLSWKAPEGHPLAGKEPVLNASWASMLKPYSSFKFRPSEGNMEDYTVACVGAFPLMRIEEMYLIEAEATAHFDAGKAATLLTDFVKTYRDPAFEIGTAEDIVDECFQQKRIELWGEGLIAWDYKRLNRSVDRTTSVNFADTENYKTNGRPAWLNLCIPQTEINNNTAMSGKNNPDPSNTYTPVIKETSN